MRIIEKPLEHPRLAGYFLASRQKWDEGALMCSRRLGCIARRLQMLQICCVKKLKIKFVSMVRTCLGTNGGRMAWLAIYFFFTLMTCRGSDVSDLEVHGLDAFKQKNYDLAIEYFSKAIQLDANCYAAYSARGQIYSKIRKYDEALADLNEAILLHPDAFDYSCRGFVYSAKQMPNKASADYSEAVLLNPNNGENYFDRATEEIFQNEWDAALIDFSTAILLFQSQSHALSDAYSGRGLVYYLKGDQRCIDDLSMALQYNPNSILAHMKRGLAYSNLKLDFIRALGDYNAVIQLDPTNAAAYAGRGAVYGLSGSYTNAIADFKAALHLDSNCVAAYQQWAWLLLTCPDPKIQDVRKAFEKATKACELDDWKNPRCFNTLAAAYSALGIYEEAVKWQAKFIDSTRLSDELKKRAVDLLGLYKQKKPYSLGPTQSTWN